MGYEGRKSTKIRVIKRSVKILLKLRRSMSNLSQHTKKERDYRSYAMPLRISPCAKVLFF